MPDYTNPTVTRLWPGEYRFCPMCGEALRPEVKGRRVRMVCTACGWVHFRDPAVGAAVVVHLEARLLFVRRGPTSTRPGLWCFPAGFVDYGEDIRAAAAREAREETGLVVEVGDVVQVASNFHDPAKLSVGVWFDAVVTGGVLTPGDDADDAGWFALGELPDLAFDTDVRLLRDRFGVEL